ncbi:MAG TPA: hypothetical protein VML00_06950 [Bacteroidota bacterium]|nr:hypothetical protein [Bacteroidota bacterium]
MIMRRVQRRLAQMSEMLRRMEDLQAAVGRVEMRQLAGTAGALRDYEFRVFSQFGEDGIIQHLIRRVSIPSPVFVEFGVQDYRESNTRFLLQNNNWTGLVMDADAEGIAAVRNDPLYYRHGLRSVCAFIERENINDLLRRGGVSGDIGLLSVDIDGNDYWVWEAIDAVAPRIVVCEFENLFGCTRAVSSPYDRAFDRRGAHYSFLYGGASLPALALLGRRKGYRMVGATSAGNNAFFVREDVAGALPAVTPREAFVPARFRSSRDRAGNLSFLDREEGLALIADLPLVDVETGATIRVRDIARSTAPY